MNLLGFLWRGATGQHPDCSREITRGLRQVRAANDLHLQEVAAARSIHLDTIDREDATARTLRELVDTMTKDQGR